MCGIAGVFGRADREAVPVMLRALAHRGPDDEHWVGGDTFTLGARRLSILDLSAGRQPLADESGTIWAAQNGEIYNFPELRRRLVASGHQLRTHCDTEVLPHLFEEHGVECPVQLDGMFAIAIFDSRAQVGLLARDRVGKKPLYYCRRDGALYFASEIKALLTLPGFARRVDRAALHHYLSYKHVPAPLTIYEGIAQLPPAHALVFRPGEEPHIFPYWRLDCGRDTGAGLSEEEIVDRLEALLRASVRRRLMSDVPLACFLSGGIDSSLITAFAAEASTTRLRTFCLTYADGSSSEGKELDRRWSRFVAQKYGTEHHEETVSHDEFPASLQRMLGCFDEPFAGVFSTYYLAQAISRHVKVALSGDGADELFGSYLSHRLAFPLARFAEYRRTGDASLIHPFEDQLELLERLHRLEPPAWRAQLWVFTDEQKAALYARERAPEMAGFRTLDQQRQLFAELSARDPLNRVLEAELQTQLPDQVLTFVDRLSMAHSLEIRAPFLDTALVEFAAGLPGTLKMPGGRPKGLLKRVAARHFPTEMVHRPKEGFLMPIATWLRRDLEPYVRQTLSPERLALHGMFDPTAVRELVERLYREGSDYHDANRVLSLVVFQEWYELFIA
jgi:asparagine synthase (glutamine-hydrolysing)